MHTHLATRELVLEKRCLAVVLEKVTVVCIYVHLGP